MSISFSSSDENQPTLAKKKMTLPHKRIHVVINPAAGHSRVGLYHWHGKEIALDADPHQEMWIDGEFGGQTPFTVRTMSKALKIVVLKNEYNLKAVSINST